VVLTAFAYLDLLGARILFFVVDWKDEPRRVRYEVSFVAVHLSKAGTTKSSTIFLRQAPLDRRREAAKLDRGSPNPDNRHMHRYVIEGGYPLKGRIRANGNKNAALPCVAACLLTSEKVTLTNVPEIEDILVMFEILKDLGCEVKHLGPNTFAVKTLNIKKHDIAVDLAKKVRASILFAGPMLARVGKVVLPLSLIHI
jgi:hypothetical protein